jgi:nicotinamidase-related amidase
MNGRNDWGLSAGAVDLRRPPRPARPLTVAAEPQQLTLDLARTALVVVDMQNDFCHPAGWLAGIGVDVSGAAAPAAAIAGLLPRLRQHDVPVIWLNWGNRPDLANLPPGGATCTTRTGPAPGSATRCRPATAC